MKARRLLSAVPYLMFGFILVGALPPAGVSGEKYPSDLQHKGVVLFEPYQVFPENRKGNAIYLNNRMVFSLPEVAITHIMPLPQEGRFVYLTRNDDGNIDLGIHLPPTDLAPRITKVAEAHYYAVMVIDGVVYKKAYRVLQNNSLVDLLPLSKTAAGLVGGEPGVVFYHISTAQKEEQNGKTVNKFGIILHLSLFDDERLRHLDYPVYNTLPRLNISWVDKSSIQYRLADGRVEVVSISQFQ